MGKTSDLVAASVMADPLHILVIPSWYRPSGPEGIFVVEHARMIHAAGDTAGVIYLDRPREHPAPLEEMYERDGVQYLVSMQWHLPKTGVLRRMWLRQYVKLFDRYVALYGAPDLIHAHGYVAGIAARYLSSRAGMPYVLTEHSTALPAGNISWYQRRALRRVYRDADILIAVSAFLSRSMEPYASGREIEVVFNPVDAQRFHAAARRSDHPRIIWVGAWEERKNPVLMLRAAALLQESLQFDLVMIGSGPGREDLRAEARRLRIPDHVRWLGPLTLPQIAAEMAVSDILISTSRLETFGMTTAEALTCGLPVVATDSGPVAELMDSKSGIIVGQDDVHGLVAAVKELLMDPSLYDKAHIRNAAVSRFSFPVIYTQVRKLYGKALASRGFKGRQA